MLRIFLFLLITVFTSGTAVAINTVRIVDRHATVSLARNMELLATSESYTWPWQVEKLPGWRASTHDDLEVGPPGKEYWSRITVDNGSGSFNIFMLALENSMLDNVEVYLVDHEAQRIEKFWTTGLALGPKSKPYPASSFVFPIYFKQDMAYDIYIKIVNDTASYVPVTLTHIRPFAEKEASSRIFTSIVEGIILLASCYSLLMFAFIRERRFMHYSLFCLSMLALLLYLSGFISLFSLGIVNIKSQQIYFFISNLFYIGLVFSFGDVFKQLGLVRKFGRYNRCLILWPLTMGLVCWFVPSLICIISNLSFMALLTVIYLYIGVNIWGRSTVFHKIYLVSAILFLIAWIGNTINKFGIYYIEYMSDSVMFGFAAVGSFSLSFTLVYRTYIEKRSRLTARQRRLLHSQRLIDMYHQANEGFFSIDVNGRILSGNKSFFAMFGYTDLDDFRSSRGQSFLSVMENESLGNEILSDLILTRNEEIKQEILMKHRNGSNFSALVTFRVVKVRDESVENSGHTFANAIEGIIVDISENKQIRQQIDYAKNHDGVTMLHNRVYMLQRIQEIMDPQRIRTNASSSDFFLFLDIDHFKVINNSCGSAAGDSFLRQVGKTLRSLQVADCDLARLGGDEFGIVITDSFVDSAVQQAESIRDAIQKLRFEWNSNSYSVTVSIGLVSCKSVDASSVLSLAETACGAAKIQGRNRVYLYSELSDDVLNYKKEMGWIAQIYKAIEQHKFVLFRQKINSRDEKLKESYEVFVRLLGDNGNILPARTFINAAQKFGLVTHIDSIVFQSVTDFMDKEDLSRIGQVFINMSDASISSLHMHRKIRRLLSGAQFDLSKLCFEFSERSMLNSFESLQEMINLIRPFGCKFAIDHYEAGIRSYEFLDQIKPDFVKINCESLVRLHKMNGSAIIESVKKMLEIKCQGIIVMHIKTREGYEIVRKYGFDGYQGVGLDRPLPINYGDDQEK